MSEFSFLPLVFVGIASLFLLGLKAWRGNGRPTQRVEFPGPALIPWIGRVHDLPIRHMWMKFTEWADKYGPIYLTEMLGAKFLVVSDESIAEELLVRRAKIYSDRPIVQSIFDSKSTNGSMEYLPLMGRNKYWARQRKFGHANLAKATRAQYYGIMDFEAKRGLYRLLKDPKDFQNTLEDMTSKIMCQLTWDNPSYSEELRKSAETLLIHISPAGTLTNVLTPLWHLPYGINPWKISEWKRHQKLHSFWLKNFNEVRDLMAKNEARPSFTRKYLKNSQQNGLSGDYEGSCALGMMALVGIVTVGGPLNYFCMSMALHPEWQQKAQAEIDQVCGDNMPTLVDSPKLPVLRACITETMRWKPNIPTGIAHEVEEDDFYNGAFIAKGTRILPLDWAFMRNPVKYPDPENYRPERFLEPSWPTYQLPLSIYPNIKGLSSFGWGQRQCLGKNITQDELLVACGALLWGFNLGKKIDQATGLEIDIPHDNSTSLFITKPEPFQMAFVPRSEKKKEAIIGQWRMAKEKDEAERAEFLTNSRLVKDVDVGNQLRVDGEGTHQGHD